MVFGVCFGRFPVVSASIRFFIDIRGDVLVAKSSPSTTSQGTDCRYAANLFIDALLRAEKDGHANVEALNA